MKRVLAMLLSLSFALSGVFVTAIALVILLVVALPAAYALARFKFRGNKRFASIWYG